MSDDFIRPENIKEGFITDDAEIFERLIRIQLVSLRKSKHLTQKELAEITGLSVGTISHIESGSNSINMRTLAKYLVGVGGTMYIDLINKDEDSDKDSKLFPVTTIDEFNGKKENTTEDDKNV